MMRNFFLKSCVVILLVCSPTFSWGGVEFDRLDDFLGCGTIDMSGWSEMTVTTWVNYNGSDIGTNQEHEIFVNWSSAGEANLIFRIEPDGPHFLECFIRVVTDGVVGGGFTKKGAKFTKAFTPQ